MGRIRLAKTSDSRTRGKKKPLRESEQQLLQQLQAGDGFANYLLSKGFSSSSTGRYVRDSERFIQWLKGENVEPRTARYADILHYIQSHRDDISKRTASTYINSIKHYYNYLVSSGRVRENPTLQIRIRGIKRKILYDILNRQELDRLYRNYDGPKDNSTFKNQNWFYPSLLAAKRNRVIVGLIICQGLTTHELSQLTPQDINLREGKIYAAGGRRSNERELKLEAYQMLDLMEYVSKTRTEILQHTGKQSNKLFTSIGSGESFNTIITKLTKKLHQQNARIKSVKQLRASVITHWLKLYNLRQVQYMAGHRFVSSTEGYMINDLDDLHEEILKYHPTG